MSEYKNLFTQYREQAKALCSDAALQALQTKKLLPVILEEKQAFVRGEYGRLQQIMGAEYTEGNAVHVFHAPSRPPAKGEDRVYGDPEELTLAELAMVFHLTHQILRFGTVSSVPLMQSDPRDKARMALLATLYEKLMVGRACNQAEVQALLDGHADYMCFRRGDEVQIIQ